jgi:hypothetical protein
MTNTNPLPNGEKIKAMLATLSSLRPTTAQLRAMAQHPTTEQIKAWLNSRPAKTGAKNDDRK